MKSTLQSLFISFWLIICLVFGAHAQEPGNIDERLQGSAWEGLARLSSGHTSRVEIELRDKTRFYFNLPDEEIGYEYSGKVTKAVYENGRWVICASIAEEKTRGIDMNTEERIDRTKAIDLSFEVIIEGQLLMATPGPEEMIEGTIRFQGASPDVQWFLDKTGTVALNGSDR